MTTLAEIKSRLEKADAGPWQAEEVLSDGATDIILGYQVPGEGYPTMIASCLGSDDDKKGFAKAIHNAKLIANAPSDIKFLLGKVEEAIPYLKTALACMKEQVPEIWDIGDLERLIAELTAGKE